MLDHSAGIAAACGAQPTVIHPGFLLGRDRDEALAAVVQQLAELRQRLEPKGRGVPFGVEIMGRARELGSLEDVLAISERLGWVRPVLDFAHLHAVTDGGFTSTDHFATVLAAADAILEPDIPFHIHFSDVSFAKPQREGAPSLRAGQPSGRAARRGARRFQPARDRDW